jgi:tetratricopeptide (TPR) repeat protein
MTRAIVVGLGIALSFGIVLAQPKPPIPVPAPGSGSGSGSGSATTKAENLTAGGTDRPWANGVSQERQDVAIRLFGQGNELLSDGIFIKAVEVYAEALKSWDHPAIHYNMALALTKLDRPLEVEESLQKAIAFGPAPLDEKEFEHAKEFLELNAKLLAWIDVSCDKAGAKVSVDGKEVFVVEAGKPNRHQGRVRIGKHTFVAQKTGYNAQIDAPFIEPGQKFRIELKLYTSEELRRYTRKWESTWLPYAVIGGGVAFGLAGGAFQLSANQSYKDYDKKIALCNADSGNGGCDVNTPGLNSDRDSGNTKRTIGYVGYGIAGAAIITGAVLIYVNRETSYEITADEYRRQQGAQPPVAITPIVAPGMAGAMVYGRF